jgi:hypothetical protein
MGSEPKIVNGCDYFLKEFFSCGKRLIVKKLANSVHNILGRFNKA